MTEPNNLCGATADATATVTAANTARAVGSGSLDVFATPMLVALMEQAACACLEGRLAAGQTSVGTQIAVEHTAASPPGGEITATATVTEQVGRRVTFVLTARDRHGEIGRGTHTRALVDAERFLEKLTTRR